MTREDAGKSPDHVYELHLPPRRSSWQISRTRSSKGFQRSRLAIPPSVPAADRQSDSPSKDGSLAAPGAIPEQQGRAVSRLGRGS